MSCVGGTRGVQERSVGFSGGRYLELWVLEFQSWHLPANSREKQGALWVRTVLRDDNRSEGYYSFMKLLHPQVLHSHGPNEALSLLTSLPTLSNCSTRAKAGGEMQYVQDLEQHVGGDRLHGYFPEIRDS